VSEAAIHRPGGQRDHRVDMFRGLALVLIFWDHIPGNVVGLLTPRNYGLSDAAEIFVFLAGFSSVLAYGRKLGRDGHLVSGLRVLRRVWTLYIAHVFVFALLTGVVFVTNAHVETRDFVQEMGLGYFVNDTERALLAELTLRFKPNLMDPLPLYIVLLAGFALALPLLMRRPWTALCLSAALYLAARLYGVNLPAQPDGAWFFNPLTWQVLFVAGAVAAVTGFGPVSPLVTARPWLRGALAWGCGIYLLLSALLALSWHFPAIHGALIGEPVGRVLYPIDKTSLAPPRLLHFLALAYAAAAVCRPGAWLETPPFRALRLLGRHSLEIFCAGVLLAPMADAANALSGDAASMQVATSAAGLAAMIGFAVLLEWSAATLRREGGRVQRLTIIRGANEAEAPEQRRRAG